MWCGWGCAATRCSDCLECQASTDWVSVLVVSWRGCLAAAAGEAALVQDRCPYAEWSLETSWAVVRIPRQGDHPPTITPLGLPLGMTSRTERATKAHCKVQLQQMGGTASRKLGSMNCKFSLAATPLLLDQYTRTQLRGRYPEQWLRSLRAPAHTPRTSPFLLPGLQCSCSQLTCLSASEKA